MRRQKKEGFIRSLLIMICIFLTGYLCASFWSLSDILSWVSKPKISQQLAAKQGSNKEKPALPRPKFEFYTLLTKETHQIAAKPPEKSAVTSPVKSQETTKLAKVETAKPAAIKTETAAAKRSVFSVQAASFKTRQVAEKMQAKLALAGFDVKIIEVSSDGRVWYRVVLGPFDNIAHAERAQLSMAKSEKIMGIIRKQDA